MKIKILPQELINQIAAGEVVERPASVVKELVENSLDAGAGNIVIEIENGGINLIKVTDDGIGMNKEDATLCIQQHATSKINSQEDLFKIVTLGFRGEALASISSVSQFCLTTKNKNSVSGTCVKIEDGQLDISEAGSADGTNIEVKNLFYNVPARQKYLKTAVTEFNHVVDLFLNYCLAFPKIDWKLVHNNKTVYQFPAAKRLVRIADCLGDEVANHLIEVDLKLNDIVVTGFVGKPQIARHNRKLQYLFINYRPVNEYIISKQIKQAFGTLLGKELHPVYILNFQIDNEKIDVNVHPRKLEVRFSEPQIVYRTAYNVVSRILDDNDLNRQVPEVEMKKFVPIADVLGNKFKTQNPNSKGNLKYKIESPKQPSVEFQKAVMDFDKYMERGKKGAEGIRSAELEKELEDSEKFIPEYKILGQSQNSYIIVETEEAIKIYDQHASSERVQYEKIKREWQIGKLASQKMLIPQNIELTASEARLINDNSDLFERLGFEIENFGGNSFAISAVPQFLAKQELKQIVLQLLDELTETVVVEDRISEPIDKIFKMMACKSAIKFGDELSFDGMEALINDLEKLDNQYTCVHGRPCVVEFKFQELNKMFKRI